MGRDTFHSEVAQSLIQLGNVAEFQHTHYIPLGFSWGKAARDVPIRKVITYRLSTV